MQDRRRHSRARAFQAGSIASRGHRAALDCVVRNLSSGGALLLLDEPMRAPCEMELTVAGGSGCRARVVWRGAAEVGVVFSPAVSDAAPSGHCAVVVSLAEVRRARPWIGDEIRLAERVAEVSRPSARPRPDWAWPRLR